MRKRDVPLRAIALAAATLSLLAVRAAVARADEKPECCFKNPSYAGVCRVQPAEGETCAKILSYLNTTMSTGKSYCNNTEIRGGWEQATCEKAATDARLAPVRPPALARP